MFSLNVGKYEHFSDPYGTWRWATMCSPRISKELKGNSFSRRTCSRHYEHDFGEYPFPNDGYKLVEALYSGVENQTATTETTLRTVRTSENGH
jgi:hypothetical protein